MVKLQSLSVKDHYQIDREFELNLLQGNILLLYNHFNHGKILYDDISEEGLL